MNSDKPDIAAALHLKQRLNLEQLWSVLSTHLKHSLYIVPCEQLTAGQQSRTRCTMDALQSNVKL